MNSQKMVQKIKNCLTNMLNLKYQMTAKVCFSKNESNAEIEHICNYHCSPRNLKTFLIEKII